MSREWATGTVCRRDIGKRKLTFLKACLVAQRFHFIVTKPGDLPFQTFFPKETPCPNAYPAGLLALPCSRS